MQAAGPSCDTGRKCKNWPHWPVSCDTAHRWLNRKKPPLASRNDDDRRYREHYQRWEDSQASVQNAIKDTEDVRDSWLGNMADQLGLQVTELGFLIKACEEIVGCRRVIPWVHAYSYFLGPEHDGNKHGRLDRLLEKANRSLRRREDVAVKERASVCAAEVEVICDLYPLFKTKLMDLTAETRHDFEELGRGVLTDFQD